MKNCEQFREWVEAYALGALDADERAALDAHLASGCMDCARAAEEARDLVSYLAYLAPDQIPAPTVKDRLMRTVLAEARALRSPVPVSRTRTVWAWMGVAALVTLTLFSAWDVWRLRNRLRDADDRTAKLIRNDLSLQEQLALTQREVSIFTDPASVEISLLPQNPQTPPLKLKWHAQLGMVVTGQQVPLPAGNRVFQLWLIPKAPGSKPVPSLTLRPSLDGRFVLPVLNPPKLMAETKALAITEEPAGGSPQPTTAILWVGGVS